MAQPTQLSIRIVNLFDLLAAERGLIPVNLVREAEVDAHVGGPSTMLSLPRRLIDLLGLAHSGEIRKGRTPAGIVDVQVYDDVRVFSHLPDGNTCIVPVTRSADDGLILIGSLVIEWLNEVPFEGIWITDSCPIA